MNNQVQIKRRSTNYWSARVLLIGSFLLLFMFLGSATATSYTGNLQVSVSEQSAILNTYGPSSRVSNTDQGARALAGRPGSADPLDNWQWTSPLPQPNALCAVAYGNGIFVALGRDGAMVSSHDGITWTAGSFGKSAVILTIIYANNMFVAVGDGVYTSPDGITWKKRWSKRFARLTAVAFGNNTFVAVGSSSLTSPDGIEWTEGKGSGAYSVAYGNGIFVGTGGYSIMTSPDGNTWTNQQTFSPQDVGPVAYGKGVFVTTVAQTIYTSSDGALWTASSTGPARNIFFCNDLFIASVWYLGDYVGIITSADGLTWSGAVSGLRSFPAAVAYGNNVFVAVGQEGDGYYDGDARWIHCIYSSTDGLAWTERSISIKPNAMAYGKGIFVGVADHAFVTSSDGIEWTERPVGVRIDGISAMAYGNGVFAAVGSYGTKGVILTSPDGVTWTDHSSVAFSGLMGITYGRGMFVAVGYFGNIVTSPDGETWTVTKVSAPLYSWFSDVAYSGEKFVVVGKNVVATSPDAITWTSYASDTVVFGPVAFGNDVFVASLTVDGVPCMATSLDGIRWHARRIPLTGIGSITYASGVFVGVGMSYTDPGMSLILTSLNGVSWKRKTSLKSIRGSFYTAIFGKGIFMATGPIGIAQSGNVCTYSISPGSKEFGSDGGNISVTIKASDADCPLPALSASADWITWSAPVFDGSDGSLQVNVAANPTSLDRKGRLSIGEASLSITQAGQICTISSLTPSSTAVGKDGGTGQLALAVTPADCAWTAQPQEAAWIRITAGNSGTGNGSISYTVKPNLSKKDRSANIKVALKRGGVPQTSTINQTGQ